MKKKFKVSDDIRDKEACVKQEETVQEDTTELNEKDEGKMRK